jgi:hypothetical protein
MATFPTTSRLRHGAACLLLLCALPSAACNVPVFRYALLHWEPAVFTALVVHRGALSAEQQETVASLRKSGLAVVGLDRDAPVAPAAAAEAIAAVLPESALPRLLLLRAAETGGAERVWDAPLSPPAATWLAAGAPAHAEIARRILGGDSAVWVVLGGSNAAANEAAMELVQRAVVRGRREARLPPRDAAAETEEILLPTRIPLRLDFSTLAVPPDAPGCALLRGQIARLAPSGLPASDPVVVPVFGRGRALCALGGVTLTEDRVVEACRTLAGACSCEVKAQNPGTDIFLPVDWRSAIFGSARQVAAMPLSVPAARPDGARTAATAEAAAAPARPGLRHRLILGGLIGVATLAAATWLILRKDGR